MACRTAMLAYIFLAYFSGAVFAQDCTCRKIGAGFCLPDPTCLPRNSSYELEYKTKALEKALNQLKTLQQASESISVSKSAAINKAAQDASAAIAKAAQDASAAVAKTAQNASKSVKILETGYSQLPELGREEAGYGLYSYAVLSSTDTARSAAFLAEVFKSVPAIQDTGAKRNQLNIFYVPIKKEKSGDFADAIQSSGDDVNKLGATYASSLYDYKVGRAILDHICNPPADQMRAMCEGDASRGPYIFTYEQPASDLEPVPAPFLFVDLSDIRPGAFGEFISAFRAQVKRENIADGVRINTPRLAVLQLALTAADLLPGVQKSVEDIVHSIATGGKSSK